MTAARRKARPASARDEKAPDAAPAARGAPRGRDGAATRERITVEALRLFARQGIDGTSVRDIAVAAGVAEGALYRHFPSKEALARTLFLEGYARLAGNAAELIATTPGFEARVGGLVGLLCRLFDEHPALFTFLLLNQHDHLGGIAEDAEGNLVRVLAGLVEAAMAAGEIPAGDAALSTAMMLGAALQPAVFCLYGRLAGPLSPRAPAIAAAAVAAARAVPRAPAG